MEWRTTAASGDKAEMTVTMQKMKITLFGATGKTVQHLIAEGLKRGYELTVFARPTSDFDHPQVHIIRGELTETELLRDAIRGADAVLSALGPTHPKQFKGLPITRATEAILSVMKQENVSRFIAVSTGTAADPGDGFDFKIWAPARLIALLIPDAYRDMVGLAGAVRASDADWTMARAAVLTDRPATGRLNVGLYGHKKHSLTLPREDLAVFMLDLIPNQKFVRKAHGVSAR